MNTRDGVALFVLAFNHAKYLPQLFESIERNRADLSELVLIDNGSSDTSLQDLAAFIEQARQWGLQVTLQSNPPKTTVARALNQALVASRAELVAVIAADDFLLQDRFAAQVAALADPAVSFVYSNGYVCDEAGILSSIPVHDAHAVRTLSSSGTATRPSLFYPVPTLFTHCALFRRSALVEIGAWDERLAIEDWPLNIRLFQRFPDGCRFVEGHVSAYRRHASNVSKRRFRQYIGQKRIIECLARGADLRRGLFALYAAQALASVKRRQWWRFGAFSRAALRARPGTRTVFQWLSNEVHRRIANKIR